MTFTGIIGLFFSVLGLKLDADDVANANKIVSHIDEPGDASSNDIKQVVYDNNWPSTAEGFDPRDYGDMTGIAVMQNGSILFLHRADRVHGPTSFNDDNFFIGWLTSRQLFLKKAPYFVIQTIPLSR